MPAEPQSVPHPAHRWLQRDELLPAAGLVLAWALMCVPSFWVLPALDDWGTSSPLPLSWRALELNAALWRPLHNFERMILAPLAYPFFAHLENSLLHAVSAAILYSCAIRVGASRAAAATAALVLILSPAVSASVWSIDGVHHLWSRAFGLGALLAYLSARRGAGLLGWVGLALLSALWNEGGIAWFVVPIMVRQALVRDAGSPPHSWRLVLGLCALGVMTYFALRWGLSGRGSLGAASGRYSLSLDPRLWVRNTAMLLGVTLTTVDTVALFSAKPNLVVTALSALAGLPLLVMLVWRVIRPLSRRRLLLSALALAVLLGPFLLLGHVSEMYGHTILALVAILLAPLGPAIRDRPRRPLRVAWTGALTLFVVAALAVDTHKLLTMIETGRGAARVGQEIAALAPAGTLSELCLVTGPGDGPHGYSVFAARPGPASLWGESARMVWGWDARVAIHRRRSPDACPASSGRVLHLAVDGTVRLHR